MRNQRRKSNMSQHTPGPWKVNLPGLKVLATDPRGTIICEVSGAESNPQARADARLIAAAPRMLNLAMMVAAGNTEPDVLEGIASAILRDVEGESNVEP